MTCVLAAEVAACRRLILLTAGRARHGRINCSNAGLSQKLLFTPQFPNGEDLVADMWPSCVMLSEKN